MGRAEHGGVGEAPRSTFEDAERGLVFGRLTLDGTIRGRSTSAAAGCTTTSTSRSSSTGRRRPRGRSTPRRRSDPHGVTQRRRFRAEGRRLTDISDESLDGSAVEGAGVSDFLLEELERRRDVRMRDIVATIQSDQYRLITAEPEGALVVQGGPGTGKTAVGLHRASWLLYTHRERLRRVLVVGPNPTFMDYVSHVLPTLGEEAVEQRAVTELVDGIEAGREEEPDVARLKGDPRLREVVRARSRSRSCRRRRSSCAGRRHLRPCGSGTSLRCSRRRWSRRRSALARERFRMAVLRRFYERYGELFGPRALRSFDELERALRRGGFLTRWLDRVLPLPQPEKLVSRLLTSPAALEAASEDVLDADERKLLLRDRPRRMSDLRWSDQDVPLLDEARTLLAGAPRSYGHVIVDEAQDLSPMQLLAISRRAVDGSLTILGDVAQATGPVVYRRWQELEPYLPDEAEMEIEELRHAYRVPAEIMDFALPLLDRIAPEVEPPLAYRKGGDPPRLVQVGEEELLERALREAVALEDLDGLLAVIVPRSLSAPRRVPVPDPHPAAGEGPRVRPRRRGRAGSRRGRRRPRPARALRRAHAADEDARRRPRAAVARRPRLGRQQAVAVAPHAALVPERDEVEVRAHPQVALQLLPLPEVLLVRAALDGLARRDRVELEELEDPAQHARRVADELLVGEDVHALELLAVGLEERVAAEPVLEHPVVAARPAPPRGRDRDGNRMADDDDERRAGKAPARSGFSAGSAATSRAAPAGRDPSAATTPRTASARSPAR